MMRPVQTASLFLAVAVGLTLGLIIDTAMTAHIATTLAQGGM